MELLVGILLQIHFFDWLILSRRHLGPLLVMHPSERKLITICSTPGVGSQVSMSQVDHPLLSKVLFLAGAS
jgi:hypothetical protein